MTDMKREIKTEELNLLEFIDMLAAGRFMIPSFQRYFVWEPSSIIKLWDSIYHFYPLGSILYWRTDVRLSIHRKMGGFVIPKESVKRCESRQRSYILDGQQRATSLLISYLGGKGHIRNQESFDFSLYFDATDGSFFFEKDLLRRKWDIDPAFLLRINAVPALNDKDFNKIQNTAGFKPEIGRNLRQLQSALNNYNIALIRITGFDITGVCDIYERINQAGRKLETLDIMIARNFQDNPLIVEEM